MHVSFVGNIFNTEPVHATKKTGKRRCNHYEECLAAKDGKTCEQAIQEGVCIMTSKEVEK